MAQTALGPASDRFSPRPVMLAGLLLLAVGVVDIVAAGDLLLFLGLAFVAGLDHGAIDIGGNLMMVTAFAQRSVSALSLLHLSCGIGATVGPASVGLSVAIFASGLPALWPSILLPLLLLPPAHRLKRGKTECVS